MPFQFERLAIPDLILITPQMSEDERGFFMETYKQSDFAPILASACFIQENHSLSIKGVLRGLHYQKKPHEQGKLVRVVAGEVFDVGLDIRHGSPTYEEWVGVRLSATNRRMLFLPPGFAHGFCVLSAKAEVVYLTTSEYAPEYERGVLWNDPAVGIEWPVGAPLVSSRDASLPILEAADNNFVV